MTENILWFRFCSHLTEKINIFFFQHTKHALPDSDATRMDQKLRRRRVCEKLALVPGKLDHATVVAFSVANRKKSLQAYSGKFTRKKKSKQRGLSKLPPVCIMCVGFYPPVVQFG